MTATPSKHISLEKLYQIEADHFLGVMKNGKQKDYDEYELKQLIYEKQQRKADMMERQALKQLRQYEGIKYNKGCMIEQFKKEPIFIQKILVDVAKKNYPAYQYFLKNPVKKVALIMRRNEETTNWILNNL